MAERDRVVLGPFSNIFGLVEIIKMFSFCEIIWVCTTVSQEGYFIGKNGKIMRGHAGIHIQSRFLNA